MISAVLNQVDDGLLDESDFTRAYIVSQMKKCYLQGGIDAGFFEPTPEIYFKKMIKPGEHCDNVFMTFFSFVLQRDFAVYNIHTGEWSHIYGNLPSLFLFIFIDN